MFTSTANFDLPRQLPSRLRLSILLLHPLTLAGFGAITMGIVFTCVFGSMVNFEDYKFTGNDPTANGVIEYVNVTNVRENRRQVYEYAFRFMTLDGVEHSGKCYMRGNVLGQTRCDQGDTVTIEYLSTDPSIARIVGMTRAKMHPAAMFSGVVPLLLGCIFLFIGFSKGRKNLYLLKNGILTEAHVTGKEATNTKINNRRVYKIFFEFTANGTSYRAFSKTHRIERVLDEAKEKIVYDSNDPNKAQMIDVLPKSVRRFFEGGV